ncbi:MAG TPA: TonB-dependent receptor [Vicinamibacterales bacterium]|nr:TonB-dependent receptor [Vicinamibacterales bacterium]
MKHLILATLVSLALAHPAAAQTQDGSVSGSVRDQSGAIVPGSLVEIQSSDATFRFTTDSDGAFRFLNLQPGTYRVTASLSGFRDAQRDVVVAMGRHVDVTMTLLVAEIGTSVTVTAPAPMLDAHATGAATTFASAELTTIPTSRDAFALVRTVPGVLVDRVNVGGNETGQAPTIVSKGTRPQDTVWTLDGIVITDMAAAGLPPTYFNYDNFDEIQVQTAGQDIRQQTGGVGINLITRRGTNQFHGGARGYFANDGTEWSNVPDELKNAATPVTPETADHMKQLSDYGFDVGGPIVANRAWFYGSYSSQDIRLVRARGALVDRTQLHDPEIKLNWQTDPRNMVSFLFFNGSKVKDYRSPGIPGILFEAPTATFHQDNAYTDFPLHGLWRVSNDRTVRGNLFVSANYAYYNTGNALTPEGGMDMQAGRSLTTGQSFGSFQEQLNIRPQQTVNADAHAFATAFGAAHDVQFGGGFRTTDAWTLNEWPGNGVLALENSPTDLRAQVFRQGYGGNRANYFHMYAGDTMSRGRATINVGLRFDHQSGSALPGTVEASKAFPVLVPGLTFPGYDSPFTWNNLSPRAGVTYALDQSRHTIARAAYSRYAGQLSPTTIGWMNPASTAGSATYRWIDTNGDHFAQADEVLTSQRLTQGGGFNPANPTAVTSANQIDPNLKAPITHSVVAGIERELRPNLAVEATYSYTRTTNLFGNLSGNITPRTGVTLADYNAGPVLTGTLPDGAAYSVPTYVANGAKVVAGGLGFLTATVPGYYTDYHGVEVSLVKRMSNRWMGRMSVGFNNARDHFSDPAGRYDTNGNPTPTPNEPLVDGGQFAPSSSASSGSGTVYVNAKWQVNANAMYLLPRGIEVSANVFGHQGYPYPLFRSQALGGETLPVLVTPAIDTFRYDSVWDTDVRAARAFALGSAQMRLVFDVFNLFNANTVLVRNNNILATTFNQIGQNLSPRIVRVGVQVKF